MQRQRKAYRKCKNTPFDQDGPARRRDSTVPTASSSQPAHAAAGATDLTPVCLLNLLSMLHLEMTAVTKLERSETQPESAGQAPGEGQT